MRLHRLEIQAFGPFAQRQIIDFDELSQQGIFLLNGPTGAGKTSILDAIAYALYGQLPGARSDSLKNLHSHHAPSDLAPEVVCEFSAGGRRLEVRRTPEWRRPAKRGSGTTREQASTHLRELVGEHWEALSARNDEAAAQILALLGMSMAQFTKVILLAQGDFAAFLRAKAKERQELLEKLFGTQIYQQLEIQLIEDARAANQEAAGSFTALENLQQLARDLVLQLQNRIELLLPAHELLPDSSPEATTTENNQGDLAQQSLLEQLDALAGEELFSTLRTHLAQLSSQQRSSADLAHSHHDTAKSSFESLQSVRERHTRLMLALQQQSKLLEREQHIHLLSTSLEKAQAAQILVPYVQAQIEQDLLAAKAATQLAQASAAFASVHADTSSGDLTLGQLDQLIDLLAGTLAQVNAALPLEQKLLAAAKEIQASTGKLQGQEASLETSMAAESELILELDNIQKELVEARSTSESVETAQKDVNRAKKLLAAVAAHTVLQKEVDAQKSADFDARNQAVNAKAVWLAALEERLAQAAGELASRLEDGKPCEVCGSVDHPAPSVFAVQGAQVLAREKQAKSDADVAQKLADTAAVKLSELSAQLAKLAGEGGDSDPATANSTLAELESKLTAAKEGQALILRLETSVVKLTEKIRSTQQSIVELSSKVAAGKEAITALLRESAELGKAVSKARADFASLDARIDALSKQQDTAKNLADAMRSQTHAQASLKHANMSLAQQLSESSFANSQEVLAAQIGAEETIRSRAEIAEHDKAQTLNRAELGNPEVLLAAEQVNSGVQMPDERSLEEALTQVQTTLRLSNQAAVTTELVENAVTSIEKLSQEYEKKYLESKPIVERSTLMTGLADAARGGAGNTLNMALSSYVLAARLEQVAEAASLRLIAMSNGRYTLSHSDAKASRNQKSGLGLNVIDEWTQVSRDTATLSGGESFMASLALALGLADVVQQESGGLDIETLFVDEGFGSLDEDALEQVMDALEGLRDGGRVVGLVSHVADMKSRIPVHLEVSKGRSGSSVAMTGI